MICLCECLKVDNSEIKLVESLIFYKFAQNIFVIRRFIFCAFWIFFSALVGLGQEMNLIRTYFFDKSIETFAGDAFLNVYVVASDGNILKIDSNNNVYSSSEKRIIGNNIVVDCSDPYKTLIFSEDEQKITFFDAEFAPSGKVDFNNIDIDLIKLCCAANNGFWTLEESSNNITKFAFDLTKVIGISGGNLFEETDFAPSHINENEEYLFLWQENSAAYVFDKFGNLKHHVSLGADCYGLEYPYLYYSKAGSLYIYDLKIHAEINITPQNVKVEDFDVLDNYIFVLSDKKIYLYQLK